MEPKRANNKYLTFGEVIKLAKQAGVDFGKGYPYNRLRYYTKIGLLPHAQRKSFGGPPEGAYPSWIVDKLVDIDNQLKTGRSVQSIVRSEREKSSSAPANLQPVVLTNFNNQGGEQPSERNQNEPQPNYEETGQNNPSKILPALAVATLLLLIISSSYFTAYRLPNTHGTLKSFNNSLANFVNSSRDGKFTPASPSQALKNVGEVLARNTAPFLNINVGTAISGLLTASGGIETEGADADLGIGELTASNVIYDILAGDNVTLTGGQIKTISASSATGVGSVTGTTGRITSTGGNNPVLNISTTYPGQTSITTVGTIGTGTWNGSALTDPFVSDTLTIGAGGSVNWGSLNTFPGGCAVGNYVQVVGAALTCALDVGGTTDLQGVYDNSGSPATIETAAGKSILFTETTAAASSHDLLQLTGNPATGGTFSGDLLQLTLDAADVDGFTGNGIHIIVDQSQNTGFPLLLEDDGGTDLFSINELGTVNMNSNLITNIGDAGTDFTAGGALTLASTLTMADNQWVGLGSSAGRIEFDNQATDEVNILSANVGIGTSTPGELLHLSSANDAAIQFESTTPSSKGPNGPGTLADDASVGTVAWVDPGNAATNNAVYATAVLLENEASHYLKATNFGFPIPNNVIVVGIQVEVDRHKTGGLILDNSIRIVKGGTISGTDQSSSDVWADSDFYVSFGGSSNLWGLSWTPSDINASDFGVVISAVCAFACSGGGIASIDHIRITVYYTLDWTLGIDQSDSHNFKISRSTTLGTNDSLTIDGIGVDIDGNLAVGSFGAVSDGQLIDARGTVSACGFGCYGVFAEPNATDVSGSVHGVFARVSTDDSGFTLSDAYALRAGNPVKGASDTITNAYGLYIDPQTAGGSNYGICFDCDGTFGTTGTGTGIVWGTDSTTARNIRMFRSNTSGPADFVLEDGSGVDFIRVGTLQFNINLDDTTTFTQRLCHSGANGATGNVDVGDCQATGQADFAEYYGSDGTVEPGDLVILDPDHPAESVEKEFGLTNKAWVLDTNTPYDQHIIGIVSTTPFAEILAEDVFTQDEHPVPVALSGRVPVNVSTENGPIQPGDPLTSSTTAGVAMRATNSGPIVGKALESYDEEGVGKIIVFISVGWYMEPLEMSNFKSQMSNNLTNLSLETLTANTLILGDNKITLDGSGNLMIDGNLVVAGDVKIDGKLLVNKIEVNDQGSSPTIGASVIKTGSTSVTVTNSSITSQSKIFTSPLANTGKQSLIISKKNTGKSFVVKIEAQLPHDLSFDWWIIN